MFETRKILGDESIAISVTCARVPVRNCALGVGRRRRRASRCRSRTRASCCAAHARARRRRRPGAATATRRRSPPPGRDEVFVGRLRRDPSHERGLQHVGRLATTCSRARRPTPSRSPRCCTSAGWSGRARHRPPDVYGRNLTRGGLTLAAERVSSRVKLHLGYERGEGAAGALFLVKRAATSRRTPSPPTPATTEVDQSITDVGLTTCLLRPELLRVEPEGEADELREVQDRHVRAARPTTFSASGCWRSRLRWHSGHGVTRQSASASIASPRWRPGLLERGLLVHRDDREAAALVLRRRSRRPCRRAPRSACCR